jgi:hypothetical protein
MGTAGMFKHCQRFALVIATTLALCCPALADSGISGTYVARVGNGAIFIELVETDNGRLTGRYEQMVLQPNGALSNMNASVTGAVNGTSVVVNIKPNGILTEAFTASGTYQSGNLSLSGGATTGSLRATMARGEEAEFRTQVAALVSQANRMNAERATQEALQRQAQAETEMMQRVRTVSEKMQQFLAQTPTPSNGFPKSEGRIKALTERMQMALARERAIWGRGQASLNRGQISLDIGHMSMDSGVIHMDVTSARRSFETTSGSIWEEWLQIPAPCIQAKEGASILPASINAVCLGASGSATAFRARVLLLRQAFDHTEALWQEEHQRQEDIRRAANAAVP